MLILCASLYDCSYSIFHVLPLMIFLIISIFIIIQQQLPVNCFVTHSTGIGYSNFWFDPEAMSRMSVGNLFLSVSINWHIMQIV